MASEIRFRTASLRWSQVTHHFGVPLSAQADDSCRKTARLDQCPISDIVRVTTPNWGLLVVGPSVTNFALHLLGWISIAGAGVVIALVLLSKSYARRALAAVMLALLGPIYVLGGDWWITFWLFSDQALQHRMFATPWDRKVLAWAVQLWCLIFAAAFMALAVRRQLLRRAEHAK